MVVDISKKFIIILFGQYFRVKHYLYELQIKINFL